MVYCNTITQDNISSIPSQKITLQRTMKQNYDKFKIHTITNIYRNTNESYVSNDCRSNQLYLRLRLSFFNVFVIVCAFLFSFNLYVVSSEKLNISKSEIQDKNALKSQNFSIGCPNCKIDRETLENFTLESIKKSILEKLGFTNGIPNSSNINMDKPFPLVNQLFIFNHNHIRHESSSSKSADGPISIQNDDPTRLEYDEDNKVKTHGLFATAKEYHLGPGPTRKVHSASMLSFSFAEETAKGNLAHARLWLYQKKTPNLFNNYSRLVKITIWKIPNIILKSIEVNLTKESNWIQIDLKESLEKYFDKKDLHQINLKIVATYVSKNISGEPPLVIHAKKCDSKLEQNEEDCIGVPHLEIKTDEPKNRRKKRSAPTDCRNENEPEECCRHKLVVDFEEFKWDFVIAPKKYDAYYCIGECKYLSNQKYPHTHIVTMAPANISPCCAPRSMAAINILYFNTNGNIVFGVLPGMVVERCGCQ